MVKVTAIDAPAAADKQRLGFLHGQIAVPDDFDAMGAMEIEKLFGSSK